MDKFKELINKIKIILKRNWIFIVLIIILIAAFGFYFYSHNKTVDERDLFAENYEIKDNYAVNEYQYIYMDIDDLLNSYLQDFVKKELENPEEAYELLTDATKERFNNNVEDFKKYIKSIKTINTKDSYVTEYRDIGRNSYDVHDNEDNKYTFHEKGVWNYQVTIKQR